MPQITDDLVDLQPENEDTNLPYIRDGLDMTQR